MKTATIQDVNDIGCCCPFPECPVNRWKVWDRTADPYNYFYVPFIKPDEDDDGNPLEPTDLIPKLYDAANNKDFLGHTGQAVWYEGWKVNPTNSANKAELRQVLSVDYDPETYEPLNGWMASASIFRESNSITAPSDDVIYTPIHIGITDPHQVYDVVWVHQYTTLSENAYTLSEADHTVVAVPEHWDVTADKWKYYPDAMRYYTDEAATLSLQGWPGDMNETSYYFDVTVTRMDQIELTGPLDQEGFIGDCVLDLSLVDWPTDFGTDQPESETTVFSRRYSTSGYTEKDHWPYIEDAEDWPGPPTYGMENQFDRPVEFRVQGVVNGVKYRVGIPGDWEAANAAWHAWKTDHDAWEEADPETRGDEPVKPSGGKRSTFELQWQEVLFPQKWEEWRKAHGQWTEDHADWVVDHAEWQTDHTTWENADPETRGDEPTEPTEPVMTIPKPTDPEDLPTLIQNREWSYGGPGTSAFSEEFEMAPPGKPGAARPVNMMIVCYHAAVGTKPSLHGEFINLDDP